MKTRKLKKMGILSKPLHKILKITEMKKKTMVNRIARIKKIGITVKKERVIPHLIGIMLLTTVTQIATAAIINQLKLKIRRVPPANRVLSLFICAI